MNSVSQTLSKYKVAVIAAFTLLGFIIGMQLGILGGERDSSFFLFGSSQQNQARNSKKEEEIIRVVSEESQVIEVVKKASPAVVSIVASADVPIIERCYRTAPGIDPFFDDPFLRDFFNFRIPSYCQKGTEKKRVGAASGFLVSSDGYIVTNRHVIENEDAEYTVILNDPENKGEKIKAEILAKDPVNDIAILKIQKSGLPYLEFADSDTLQVGQTAIAIGYALGEFDNTVSKGVVSGLSRSITATSEGVYGQIERLEGIIQTDAAINPGNSGGPLLDISGKVIGINTAVAKAENIGFAIPSNEVRRAYEEVRSSGKIRRPFLGVRYILIDPEIQEKNNLPYDYGALIIRGEKPTDLAVIPGSAANKAGIEENDIILEVDGIRVDTENPLGRLIAKYRVGDKVKMKIYHRGEEKEVEVEIGERE